MPNKPKKTGKRRRVITKPKGAKGVWRIATNKSVKVDDIILSRLGDRYRVWAEAGAMMRNPVLHKLDDRGKFVFQSPVDLASYADDGPFFHTDEKYVRPAPTRPEPTEEFLHETKPMVDRAKLGWISPDGRFFGCEYGQHNGLSYALNYHELSHGAEPDSKNFENDNELALEAAGWLKVFAGHGRRDVLVHSPPDKIREISRAQGDTVLAYCAAVKQRVPYWLDPVTYEVK